MRQTVDLGDNRSLISYFVTVLIFYSSGICFAIVYQEIEELRAESATDLTSSQIEIVFFLLVGFIYIPIGVWIHTNIKNEVTPYVLAIAGSSFVIVLYIMYKSILPSLDSSHEGLGTLDILGRILLGAVIIAGSYGLYSIIIRKKKTLESLR
jgi:hypothetical protein